jgi:hypothetical protein
LLKATTLLATLLKATALKTSLLKPTTLLATLLETALLQLGYRLTLPAERATENHRNNKQANTPTVNVPRGDGRQRGHEISLGRRVSETGRFSGKRTSVERSCRKIPSQCELRLKNGHFPFPGERLAGQEAA